MDQDRNFLKLGLVRGAHGLKGEVKVQSLTTSPLDLLRYKTLYSAEGKEFSILKGRYAGNVLIIHFLGVEDRESAEALRGIALFVDRALLPALEEEEFYLSDLLGLDVYDCVERKKIGNISGVFNFGAGDIIEIFLECSQKSCMVSFDRHFVIDVDVLQRIVFIDVVAAGVELV